MTLRIVAAIATSLILIGCTAPISTSEPGITSEAAPTVEAVSTESAPPSASPAATKPPRPKMTCKKAPKSVLRDAEALANIGGAVRYVEGQMVRAGGEWWAVAVRIWVDPYSDGNGRKTGSIELVITNSPSDPERLRGGTYYFDDEAPYGREAGQKAEACLKS